MELRTLRYLLAVADHLSFTAAARSLNVSQPALSQQIRHLEEALGIQLLERTPQRVSVTQAGQLVIDHARRVLDGTARLKQAVAAFKGLERGKLRIAVTQSFNALHLAPLLASFLERHPAIDVTALEWTNAAIIEGVGEGTLDLGVAFGPSDGLLSGEPLYQDQLMLACSKDHGFARLPRVAAHALSGQRLALLTAAYSTRRALDRFFEAHAVEPVQIVELDSFASILKIVETGLCVSVIPGSPTDANVLPSDVVMRVLDPAPPSRTIQLLLPPIAARSPAAVAFAEALRRRFRPKLSRPTSPREERLQDMTES